MTEATAMRPAAWLVVLDVPARAAARFAAALAPFCASVATVVPDSSGTARVEGIAVTRPDPGLLDVAVALAAVSIGVAEPKAEVRSLAPADWLEATRRAFPPIRAGRYFLYGSHFEGRVPAGLVGLAIDAGTAFGSGRHESTQGCLLALDRVAKRFRVRRALDVGSGSGVLALAIAKTWRAKVIACDVDPEAVRVTRSNAKRNGAAAFVRACVSDGVTAAAARRGAPYDLVTANILTRPLIRMARGLAALLAPGGVMVLSGMLGIEGKEVLSAYRGEGLKLLSRIDVGDWCTLILGRGAGPRSRTATRRVAATRDGPSARP
ncbi:MAG: 50S ribosomal protein L11 methyltransferase [Alphaproteobacteria bacterium]